MRVRLLVLTSCLLSVVISSAAAESTGVREVTARKRSIIPLTAQTRHFTTIVLPEDEEIIDVSCGDPDFWIVQSAHNIARVKPAEQGATTNFELQTRRMLYSFRLREATGTKAEPDFKVYVRLEDDPGTNRFFTAAQMEAVQAELTETRAALEAERRRVAEAIEAHKAEYVTTLQFVYRWKDKDDLRIRAIWHDGQSTYLQLEGRELPALYELKDGPALTNYQVVGHTYIIPKLLERGYLSMGKTRVTFERR